MPKRPPKEWWDKMEKEVKEGNPDYSEEQVRKTVGDIWYHKMSPSKKQKETKKSEGSLRVEVASVRVEAKTFSLPDYAGESDIFELYKLLELYHAGQGDPIYAVMSRRDPDSISEEELSEIGLLLSRVSKSREEEDEARVAADWLPVIESMLAQHETEEEDEDEIPLEHLGSVRVEAQAEQASVYPGLISKEWANYIKLEVTRAAASMGPVATPEQAEAFVDKAAQQVAQQIASGISPAVLQVVKDNRDEILKSITPKGGMQAKPAVPAPIPSAAPAAAPQTEPEEEETAAPTASTQPRIVRGEWVLVEGDTGQEWIPGDILNLKAVRNLIDHLEKGQPINLRQTALNSFVASDKAFDIDIRDGFGVRPVGDSDSTQWMVFETEAEASRYLKALN